MIGGSLVFFGSFLDYTSLSPYAYGGTAPRNARILQIRLPYLATGPRLLKSRHLLWILEQQVRRWGLLTKFVSERALTPNFVLRLRFAAAFAPRHPVRPKPASQTQPDPSPKPGSPPSSPVLLLRRPHPPSTRNLGRTRLSNPHFPAAARFRHAPEQPRTRRRLGVPRFGKSEERGGLVEGGGERTVRLRLGVGAGKPVLEALQFHGGSALHVRVLVDPILFGALGDPK
nr:hypothetical protein Itr_chr02CG23190 [Ipomoea trifida]